MAAIQKWIHIFSHWTSRGEQNIVKFITRTHLKKQQYVLLFCRNTSQFSAGFVISDAERCSLDVHVLPDMPEEDCHV